MHVPFCFLLLIGAGAATGLSIAGGALDLRLGRTFQGLQYWAMLGLVSIAGAAAAWIFLRQ